MSRTAVIERLIREGAVAVAPFEVIPNLHPAWVSQHPSGFDSVVPRDGGNVFWFSPAQIMATTTHLNDDELVAYCDSIVYWWAFSTMWFTLEPRAVERCVAAFATELPNDYMAFASHPSIMQGEFTVAQWLAPSRLNLESR